MANDTLLFKDVCPTLEEFTTSDIAKETMPHIAIAEVSNWVNEVYRLLKRHYRNYEICFTNVDDFLDMLWERIEIHAPNFFERRKWYEKMLHLSDRELYRRGSQIINYVRNTNERYTDPFEKPLQNITDQTSSEDIGEIPSRIRSQIYAAQMTLISDFLDKFKNLFILVTSHSDYYG